MKTMNEYCIINGVLKSTNELSANHIISGQSIYEVLKVVNGKAAFFNNHIRRLLRSAALTGKQTPDTKSIHDGLQLLIESSSHKNGNIEITVNGATNWCIKYIPHYYPNDDQYLNGVKCKFYDAQRENPNAKVKRVQLRENVGEFIASNNIFEALYANNGIITEGSRTNVFFILNNQIFTASKELILQGITRQIVIEIVNELDLKIHEKIINTNDVSNFQAAFLTGTSPGILPISAIEQQKFDVKNPSLRLIMEKYQEKLAQ